MWCLLFVVDYSSLVNKSVIHAAIDPLSCEVTVTLAPELQPLSPSMYIYHKEPSGREMEFPDFAATIGTSREHAMAWRNRLVDNGAETMMA